MKRAIDDLWRLAHDEEPRGAEPDETDDEAGRLLEAWYHERGRRIEGSLVLQRVRGLLAELLAEDDLDPARRRQARRLLAAIRAVDPDRT